MCILMNVKVKMSILGNPLLSAFLMKKFLALYICGSALQRCLGRKTVGPHFTCVCAWTLVLYRAQIRYDGPKCWRSFVLLSAFGATFVMNNKARNRSTDMVVGRKKNLPHSLPPLHNHLVSQFSKPVCW